MTAALPRLLRTVRRRLTAAEIVRVAALGLWWAAAVTLALGVVHRWWLPLAPAFVVALALAPPVLAVLWAAWRRRPSLETCARHVDRLFDGHELIVAGWEIARARTEPVTATERLVERRAETAAATWLARLPGLREPSPQRRTALAIALTAAGAFLLANPSLAPPRKPQTPTTAAATATAATPGGARDIAPELAAAEGRARPMTENETPGPTEPEGREPVPLLIPQLRAGVDAGRAQETGQLAATARASTRPEGRAEPVAMEVRLIRADSVDSAAQRAAGAGSVELDATAPGDAALRTAPTTRNAAGLVTALNRFAPAERHYLAAYFETQAERSRVAAQVQTSP